jgi:hypothetical protein
MNGVGMVGYAPLVLPRQESGRESALTQLSQLAAFFSDFVG